MLPGEQAMLVRDRMTLRPIIVSPETTHKQAAELIREHKIHHLPVVDNKGNLVGIVVEQDLLAAQPSPATTLSIYEIHSLLSKLEVRQIMSHPVFTTTGDCPLEEAARLMLDKYVGCLPVMENNRLVGMITDTDIFEALVLLLGGGQEGARFTLRLPDKPGMLARVAQAVADAEGNIISVTTWQSKDDGKAYITIKERGANFARLKQALDVLEETELVDLHEKPACVQQLFGQV
jgi:acetoin utilization protein AcuB